MRKEPNWTFRTLDIGHWPMVSTPNRLVALLAGACMQGTQRGPQAILNASSQMELYDE